MITSAAARSASGFGSPSEGGETARRAGVGQHAFEGVAEVLPGLSGRLIERGRALVVARRLGHDGLAGAEADDASLRRTGLHRGPACRDLDLAGRGEDSDDVGDEAEPIDEGAVPDELFQLTDRVDRRLDVADRERGAGRAVEQDAALLGASGIVAADETEQLLGCLVLATQEWMSAA